MSESPHRRLDLPPFEDFAAAARAALELLHDRMGMGLWAVTQAEAGRQRILVALDHRYATQRGDRRGWLDAASERMLRGLAPRAAPNCRAEPAYADLPISPDFPVRAYVGAPLQRADGTPFGTLCAVDPLPQTSSLYADLPLVELLARVLSTFLSGSLPANDPTAVGS